ncbi:phage baseplate protein [Pseudomonas citronellolis]|uniref:Phage baseplate protein n=1 Tax=Pseudomonas citronellolis TaxID=53408 RepID=A0A1A9KGY5_9PSED|nr:phage baseplate assembly protein V [Pseudomonas citronellolis]ANI16768.1 phage baseplate protein [Pseudomonas citronellolis]
MSYPLAEHDRMLGALIIPCVVAAVDLAAARVRVTDGEWTSAWVRWHDLAAGQARHWRAPTLGEQGVLFSPSGVVETGTFVPGLFGSAGPAADNRDHVDVWRFPDGGSLVYDWAASRYSIELPSGSVTVKVGGVQVLVDDASVSVQAGQITLQGEVAIQGNLAVQGNITSTGSIMDTTGNSNHHTH